MTGLDFETWATLIGTWILIVGTLAFAYWQMRQTQRINSAKTILDLRDRFDAPTMRAARRELSALLIAGDTTKEVESYDVMFFFQLMGTLTHERILDQRMVWNAFGPWITGYYYSLTHPVDRIAKWRGETRDATVFQEFERLAREMVKLDGDVMKDPSGKDTRRDDALDMLDNESRLAMRG